MEFVSEQSPIFHEKRSVSRLLEVVGEPCLRIALQERGGKHNFGSFGAVEVWGGAKAYFILSDPCPEIPTFLAIEQAGILCFRILGGFRGCRVPQTA